MKDFGVIELRRYVLRPGMRESLITLFEREFIESQEACGMVPIGHYRDLDDPNSFVWFRGFETMETRRSALEGFYIRSEAWNAHRDEANATMVDSDNVLLLRNARPGSGFNLVGLERDDARNGEHLVAVSMFMLGAAASNDLIRSFDERLVPQLRRHASRISYFVTEDKPNNFPRLPVREGEWAFVVVGICESPAAMAEWAQLVGPGCETLRLSPADRSLFH